MRLASVMSLHILWCCVTRLMTAIDPKVGVAAWGDAAPLHFVHLLSSVVCNVQSAVVRARISYRKQAGENIPQPVSKVTTKQQQSRQISTQWQATQQNGHAGTTTDAEHTVMQISSKQHSVLTASTITSKRAHTGQDELRSICRASAQGSIKLHAPQSVESETHVLRADPDCVACSSG